MYKRYMCWYHLKKWALLCQTSSWRLFLKTETKDLYEPNTQTQETFIVVVNVVRYRNISTAYSSCSLGLGTELKMTEWKTV